MKNLLALAAISAALVAIPMQAAAMDLPGYYGGKFTVPVVSLKEARFKKTLHQQYDFSCGSAAVATLLTYQYDYPVTEQQVFAEMFERGDREKIRKEGFSLLDIKEYLARHGFLADGFEQPLQKLVDTGLPAIVLIVERGYHHFVVVKGMRDGRILVGDPSSGTRAIPRDSFEKIWFNKLMFVIHTQQRGQPIFNAASDWRVAPRAPISTVLNNDGLGNVTLPKMGPGDF